MGLLLPRIDQGVRWEGVMPEGSAGQSRAAGRIVTFDFIRHYELTDELVSYVGQYVIPVNWRFPENGALDFLAPGRQENGNYVMRSARWTGIPCTTIPVLFLADHLEAVAAELLIGRFSGLCVIDPQPF